MSLTFHAVNGATTHSNLETRAHVVLGVNFPLYILALGFVSARILVKAKLRKLGREDVLIVISTLITLVLMVLTTYACRFGFGVHITDFRPEWELTYSKISYALIVLGGTCYPITKISMLCFYIRLAPHRTFSTICYFSILYIALSSTALTLINLFGCTPISGGWDRTIHPHCIDASIFYYVYSSLNAGTDVLLMVLPIPILMRMQIKVKVKIGLVAMFAAGILIAGISAYGVFAMYEAYHSTDVTWDGSNSWMWGLVEFNAGIITACMPSMLMFMKWVRGDMNVRQTHTPGVENVTIGGGGYGGRGRKWQKDDLGTDVSCSSGGDEYEIAEMGEITIVREGLVERGDVVG